MALTRLLLPTLGRPTMATAISDLSTSSSCTSPHPHFTTSDQVLTSAFCSWSQGACKPFHHVDWRLITWTATAGGEGPAVKQARGGRSATGHCRWQAGSRVWLGTSALGGGGSALTRASMRSPVPVPLMALMAMGEWPSAQKSAACSSALPTFSHLFTARMTCGPGPVRIYEQRALCLFHSSSEAFENGTGRLRSRITADSVLLMSWRHHITSCWNSWLRADALSKLASVVRGNHETACLLRKRA